MSLFRETEYAQDQAHMVRVTESPNAIQVPRLGHFLSAKDFQVIALKMATETVRSLGLAGNCQLVLLSCYLRQSETEHLCSQILICCAQHSRILIRYMMTF